MRAFGLLSGLALMMVLLETPTDGATHTVPDPFPTIQAAVDAAVAGDTVLAASGDYLEDVLITDKAIHVRGAGPESTRLRSCEIVSLGSTPAARGSLAGFTIEEPLSVTISWYEFDLENCVFDGPVTVIQPELHQLSLVLISNCTFRGTTLITNDSIPGGEVRVQQCRFYDRDLRISGEARAVVVGSEFYDCGIRMSAAEGSEVSDSIIQGLQGIRASSEQTVVIENNVVTSAAVGIDVPSQSGSSSVLGNDVSDCGVGIRIAQGAGSSELIGNLVSACQTAIEFDNDGPVERNVVQSCVTGIVAGDDTNPLSGNTIFACEGVGMEVAESFAPIHGNIVAKCDVGIRSLGELERVITCNNVWDNHSLNWDGVADPVGSEGNISVDPLFCVPLQGNLTLAEDSPCLPDNHPDGFDCGTIGALGQGCGVSAGIDEGDGGGVATLRLLGVHPNPARFDVRCRLFLEEDQALRVELVDVAGRSVATLYQGTLPRGSHEIAWSRTDASQRVPAGVYQIVIVSGTGRATASVVLIGS